MEEVLKGNQEVANVSGNEGLKSGKKGGMSEQESSEVEVVGEPDEKRKLRCERHEGMSG